jgi:hypothetical protein
MHDAYLPLNDASDVRHQLLHRRARTFAVRRVGRFEAWPGIHAAYGFAKCLRRDRARIDTDAADRSLLLDDGDALAKL